MAKWMQVLSTAVIGVSVFYLQRTTAFASFNKDLQSETENINQTVTFLTVAWIFDPPYIIPVNGSPTRDEGLIRDALIRYVTVECGHIRQCDPISYEVIGLQAHSELGMIELLRTNKADMAAPIFKNPDSPRYSEFPFFKIVDYPGTDFFTIEDQTNPIRVVVDAVFKSWPLLALTVIIMAIAGVIMWALDTYWNSEEFPRSFIKGSWHGFWWSFISATTVGYGDKAPKSVAARVFSVVWILVGIINIALITANITSTLTALALHMEPSSLDNLKVAVLSNGTEYQHALQEGAQPKVYNTIDDATQAVETKEVNGMLLDRYKASHYQSRGKLKSLIAIKKLEYRKSIGVLFSKKNQRLADCLDFYRSDIWRLVQTLTATYKLTQQKPAGSVGLFYNSSPFINYLVYPSLGTLLGLLFVGTAWDFLIRKKKKVQQDVALAEVINDGTGAKRQAIQKDLEVGRRLLLQMQEQFNELEAKFSELHVPLP